MPIDLLLLGIVIGLMVAVPVGPLGLLCVNRALSRGPLHGLFSGMGVATADALAAGITALGMTLISDFLIDHQTFLRTVGGLFLCYLGIKIYRTKPATQMPVGEVWRPGASLRNDFSSDRLQSGDHPIFRCDLCRLGNKELERSLPGCCALGWRGFCRFSFMVVGP